MIRSLILSVISVFTLTISIFGAAAPAQNMRGKHNHSIVVDGLRRDFIVYVPARAIGGAAPVVFMLHGSGDDGENAFRISGWREKADEMGLIAVFPTALVHCLKEDENSDGDFADRGETKVTTRWASGKLGTAAAPQCSADELALLPARRRALADHPLADDVAFFSAMLTELSSRYNVDERRIYASGFSNGASMTSRLALEMSDSFAAIGAAAGSLELPASPAPGPVSALASFGVSDETYSLMLGVPAIPAEPTLFQDVPALYPLVVAPMLTTLQLAGTYQYGEAEIRGATVARFLFQDSLVGESNAYALLVIEGLHHQYPNGKNHPMVMADVSWEFFRLRSLPD